MDSFLQYGRMAWPASRELSRAMLIPFPVNGGMTMAASPMGRRRCSASVNIF